MPTSNVPEAAVDGFANGLGFTVALTIMGVICEFFGKGSLFGYEIMSFKIGMLATPAGAFLVYGLCIAVFVYLIDGFERSRRVKANKLARENMLKEAE